MEVTQQFFKDTPEGTGNASDMELEQNLKRKIPLRPPGLYLLKPN